MASWFSGGPACGACGLKGKPRRAGVLTPELAAELGFDMTVVQDEGNPALVTYTGRRRS